MTNINPSSLHCELIFLAGSEGRKTFTKPVIRIGRQADNDFVTPDVGTSRIHAEIVWDNNIWKIRNLNPANKITLNKQDIGQEAEIHHFDEIGLGRNSATLIRFLAQPHTGNTPDPTAHTTVHMQKTSLDGVLLAEDQHKHNGSADYVWQFVGLILATVTAIITVYALSPAMFALGIATISIGVLLCISVFILSRKGQSSSPKSRVTGEYKRER
jgi:hypothetical protein